MDRIVVSEETLGGDEEPPYCHITHRCHKKEFLLRVGDVSYNTNFAGKNSGLRPENIHLRNITA
jgi:hypothetical protein